MKRVLFLTNYASPYRVHFYDELAKSMDVTVLFTDRVEDQKNRSADWFVPGGGAYRPVQLKRCVAHFLDENLCLDVTEWLKKPYDAIVICGYSSPTAILAMRWLRRKKIPFYMEVDGGLIRQERKIKYLFKKSLVRKADQWLSSGRYTTEFLVHYGAEESRIHFYPFSSVFEKDILPAVPSADEKQVLKEELGVPEKRMVLAIGQFIRRKGFDILMHAACSLDKDVGIYIVGGEPTEEYLQMRASLGLDNVHFVGFQKKEALSRYYRAADLFVLPTREDLGTGHQRGHGLRPARHHHRPVRCRSGAGGRRRQREYRACGGRCCPCRKDEGDPVLGLGENGDGFSGKNPRLHH